jgi:hypothetical protein
LSRKEVQWRFFCKRQWHSTNSICCLLKRFLRCEKEENYTLCVRYIFYLRIGFISIFSYMREWREFGSM